MIKTIEIKNFQAHKQSSFNFSPGVNVIKGPSHQGKTAVIRAIKWALTNRPATTSLKSWFSSKKDEIKVAIEFDDGFIVRKRDDSFNGYILPTEKFDAIGTDVPTEVDQISRMPDINLQSQHDPYFMIQETPQAAAKKLNEIIGLTIIDEVLSKAVKEVKERGRAIIDCERNIEEHKRDIESYSFLDQLGKLIAQIEKNITMLEGIRSKKSALSTLSQDIVQVQSRNRICKQFLTIVPKYDQLVDVAEQLKQSKSKSYRLKKAYDSWYTVDQALLHIEEGLVPISDVERLLAINDKLDDAQNELISLQMLHQSIVDLRNRGIEHSLTLRSARKSYQKMLSDAGICPLCGQKIQTGGERTHEGEDNQDGPES